MARTRLIRRWRRNMEVRDDAEYVEMLATLSEGSVRRCFNPYTDIEWDSPEFAVTDNDPRWILPNTDPLGRHPWYLAVFILLWARDFTLARLMINVVLSAYLLVGTLLEERKLIIEFGEKYKAYQRQVSMFIPLKWR